MSINNENENPLGYKNEGKLLVGFAIPCIISMLVTALYNIVDQIFIGQGIGMLGNAATNIAFPLSMNKVKNSEIKKRVHEIAKNLGIEGLLNKYPDECSGGQKQRTAIARALVNKPSIIIADEPTGNLDSKNTSELLAILKNLNEKEGKTIIMVTHDPQMASYCSRLILLKDGVILEDLEKNRNQESFYQEILGKMKEL